MSTNDAIQAVVQRRPGQYAREYVRPRATLAIAAIVVIAVGTPALAVPFGVHNPMFLGATSAEIVGVVVLYWIASKVLDPWVRGIVAEKQVGQILGRLASHGWLVLHGVQTGCADIDHLAVGPAGVVTIETKSRLGHMAASDIKRGRLKQAAAHRRRLQALVPSVTDVNALLVFTAPSVDLPPTPMRDVVVMSADHLSAYLQDQPQVMSAPDAGRAYDRIVRALALGQ